MAPGEEARATEVGAGQACLVFVLHPATHHSHSQLAEATLRQTECSPTPNPTQMCGKWIMNGAKSQNCSKCITVGFTLREPFQ